MSSLTACGYWRVIFCSTPSRSCRYAFVHSCLAERKADGRSPQLCAVDLFTAFEGLLGELKLSAVKVILHALNTAFQTSSIEGWAGALDSSAAFVKLLTPLSKSETPVLVVTKCERYDTRQE